MSQHSALREQLQRIADDAPVPVVDPRTWGRARRARRRDRALVVASAAAVLALVGGLTGALGDVSLSGESPVAAGGTAAVPGHTWATPERLGMQDAHGRWTGPVETDLAIGVSAVAYVMDGGLPVVVDARSGHYHLMDLPGFLGREATVRTGLGEGPGLTLSPDGTQLAYAWAGPAPASDATPMPSGVRVVDLRSGEVRTIPLEGGRGVLVTSIVWSPDGRWLAWTGEQTTYWTESSLGARRQVAGRIAPAARTSEAVPRGRDASTALAVTDSGVVAVLDSDRLVRWDGHVLGRIPVHADALTPAGAAAPAGSDFAFGRWDGARAATSMALSDGAVTRHRLPADVYPHGASVRPLGWIDDRLMVLEVTALGAADQPSGGHQLVVTTRRVSTTSTYRIVGHTDAAVPDTFSVAVDLMTLERPTVDRPAPDWPWSPERKALVTGAAAAAVLALLYGVRRLWRRRAQL